MSDWQYKDFGIGRDTWKYPKDGTIKNGDLKQWSDIDNLHKAQQSEIQSLQEQRYLLELTVKTAKYCLDLVNTKNMAGVDAKAIEDWLYRYDKVMKKIEGLNE